MTDIIETYLWISLLRDIFKTCCNSRSGFNIQDITLDRLGRHGEAIECYDKSIEIEPNDARVYELKHLSVKLENIKIQKA